MAQGSRERLNQCQFSQGLTLFRGKHDRTCRKTHKEHDKDVLRMGFSWLGKKINRGAGGAGKI